MRIIQKPRRAGKTYDLVTLAAERNAYIVCRNKREASRIFQMSMNRELIIAFPLTYSEISNKQYYSKSIHTLMIDELDDFLRYLLRVDVSYCTYTPK